MKKKENWLLTSEWTLLAKSAPQKPKNRNQAFNAFSDEPAEKWNNANKNSEKPRILIFTTWCSVSFRW